MSELGLIDYSSKPPVKELSIRAPHYKSISSILASGLDRQSVIAAAEAPQMPAHENVRGPGYYH